MREILLDSLRAVAVVVLVATMVNCFGPASASTAEQKLSWQIYAAKMELEKDLPKGILLAICDQESRWRNVGGRHREVGVCQIKPGTVRMICPKCPPGIKGVLEDPYHNIRWAANYLVWLRDNVSPDPAVMMAAYNGGPAHPVVKYMVSVQRRMLARNEAM